MTVVDETAPVLNVTASPASLWPPNGKLVAVSYTGGATDNCGPPTVTVLDATSTTAAPTDIVRTPSLQLRAFRDGKELAGRTYVVTYAATDAAGNQTTSTSSVTVPHDKR